MRAGDFYIVVGQRRVANGVYPAFISRLPFHVLAASFFFSAMAIALGDSLRGHIGCCFQQFSH